MNNEYLEITLTSYGFTFSTEPLYFNLSWLGLGAIVLTLIARKVYTVRRIKAASLERVK